MSVSTFQESPAADIQFDGEVQGTLESYLSLDPVKWRLEPEQAGEMGAFITGDILETHGLRESPVTTEIDVCLVRDPDEYPDTRRQYVESNLLEINSKEGFDEVARALEGERNEFVESMPSDRIPVGQPVQWKGAEINISLNQDVSEPFYRLDHYLERERRPGRGEQVSLYNARENLTRSERETAMEVVNNLKEAGATVYLTGSSLADSAEPDDVDLAVEGLTEDIDTPVNRSKSYPSPGEGGSPVTENHPGLSRGMTMKRSSELRQAIDRMEKATLVAERPERFKRGIFNPYNVVEHLFRIEYDGQVFDIGYDEEPFWDSNQKTHTVSSPEERFAKL